MATPAPDASHQLHPEAGSDLMARGLGFLSLVLGATEITGARALAQILGIRGQEHFIRLCGAREILQGATILAAREPTPWVWVRVAGDALDIGTLAAEHYLGDRSKRISMMIAIGAVLGITARDVVTARTLNGRRRAPWPGHVDVSRRPGLRNAAPSARRGRPRSRSAIAQPAEAM